MPRRLYATVAYIDRETRWDDVSFHVSKTYDSQHMWEYVKRVHKRAQARSVRLLQIVVLDKDGKQVWSWEP